MLLTTNPVVDQVKAAMEGKLSVESTENTPLAQYNSQNNFKSIIPARADISICRIFVMHNFTDGVMWVKYTYKAFDAKGNILRGAANVPSRWTIHKENGEWKITAIKEDP